MPTSAIISANSRYVGDIFLQPEPGTPSSWKYQYEKPIENERSLLISPYSPGRTDRAGNKRCRAPRNYVVSFLSCLSEVAPLFAGCQLLARNAGHHVANQQLPGKKSVAYKVEGITLISSPEGWQRARKNAPKRLLSLHIHGGITAQFLPLEITMTKLATNESALPGSSCDHK